MAPKINLRFCLNDRAIEALTLTQQGAYMGSRALLREHRSGDDLLSVIESTRAALRAHRGGGLARELVYVPAWLRVRAAVARDPSLESVLASGQISVAAAETLRPFVPDVS